MGGDGWLLALAIDDLLQRRLAFGCTLQGILLTAVCVAVGAVNLRLWLRRGHHV